MKNKFLLLAVAILNIAMSSVSQVTGTFTDSRDGKVYKTIKIGEQTWFAENLAYKVNNGCWAYDDNQSNVSKNGYLYKWETAKNVCPTGWHLPSQGEFEALLQTFGGGGKITFDALIPGGKSGFSALFAGFRLDTGEFHGIGSYTRFWSSTPITNTDATYLVVYNDGNYKVVQMTNDDIQGGYSVRCVRDK